MQPRRVLVADAGERLDVMRLGDRIALRGVKYEEVYLHDYADGWEAEARLGAYFRFYAWERPHQALG